MHVDLLRKVSVLCNLCNRISCDVRVGCLYICGAMIKGAVVNINKQIQGFFYVSVNFSLFIDKHIRSFAEF